ncbi:MFS transporter [Facklamia hominis]|uniref:MFS transporter n=1 Tax=Facklamia hominis TaxID=178214 RepID=UPI0038FD0CED
MKKKNYFKLLLSKLLDQIGNVTYDYANSVWIASMGTFGQKYLGIYQILETLIAIVFNPIAGAMADNSNRKKILLISDSISAFICIFISLMGNDQILLYGIIIANAVLSITYSFSSTAFKSIVPRAIDSDRVLAFNSLVETILQIFSVLSPIITYYIYINFGIRIALMINGFSFIGSFLAILTIVDNTDSENNSEKYVAKRPFKELFLDIKYGLKYIISSSELLELLLLSALVNFFLSFYNFLLPFSNAIFDNEEAYSRLLFFGALGSILGAFLSKFISNTRINLLLSLGLSGIGIVCIGLAKFPSIFILFSYIGNLIFMTFLSIYNIHFISRIQQNVADEYMGRVFSTVFTIAILFMPLGTMTITLMPWAIDSTMFMAIGLAITLLSLLFTIGKKSKI